MWKLLGLVADPELKVRAQLQEELKDKLTEFIIRGGGGPSPFLLLLLLVVIVRAGPVRVEQLGQLLEHKVREETRLGALADSCVQNNLQRVSEGGR